MGTRANVAEVKISDPILHGIVSEYISRQLSKGTPSASTLVEWASLGGSAFRECLNAAEDAVVISQLAVTVVSDEEFLTSLGSLRDFSDPEIEELRRCVFEESIRFVLDSGPGSDASARAERRLEKMRFALS